jgi:tRNA dimethylallyltransferase
MTRQLQVPLVVIVGPTASGKSKLALAVAKQYSGEVICADSRTVYKGMDIGTAKPSPQERRSIPHHMLDIVEPTERFTVVDFKRIASSQIDDIMRRRKLPIVVGGTGLYVDSVIFDYNFGVAADPILRKQLEQKTVLELQSICRQKDIVIPENDQNKRHLIRAIELGGLTKQNKRLRHNTLVVGLQVGSDILRQRIEQRAHDMIDAGIVDEVRRLAERYGWDNEAMTGNIYRVFRGVVEGTKSEQEAVEEFVRADVALAKRQMTWFKRNPYIVWGSPPELMQRIEQFLARPISS